MPEIGGVVTGLVRDDPSQALSNARALDAFVQASLEQNRQPPSTRGFSTVSLPSGGGRYFITHNDHYERGYAALAARDFDTLVFDGNGAELVYRWTSLADIARFFVLFNAKRVEVRNLTVSYDPPLHTQGRVVAASATTVDFVADEGFVPIALGETSLPAGALARCSCVIKYDPVENAFVHGAGDDVYLGTIGVINATSRTYRITAGPLGIPVFGANDTVVAMYRKYFDSNVLTFAFVDDVQVENVAIHSGPGLAIAATGCGDLDIEVTVSRRGGALLANTADFIHLSGTRGNVRIDGSSEGGGDDGLNVHGAYWDIYSYDKGATGADTVTADFLVTPFGIADYLPAKGDRVAVVSRTFGFVGEPLTIAAVGPHQDVPFAGSLSRRTVTFDGDLPADFGPLSEEDYFLLNTAHEAKSVSGSLRASCVYGRGAFIQARDVDLEVQIEGTTHTGLLISNPGSAYNYESAVPRRVSVRGSLTGTNLKSSPFVGVINPAVLITSAIFGLSPTVVSDISDINLSLMITGYGQDGVAIMGAKRVMLDGVTLSGRRTKPPGVYTGLGHDIHIASARDVTLQAVTKTDGQGTLFIADTLSTVKLTGGVAGFAIKGPGAPDHRAIVVNGHLTGSAEIELDDPTFGASVIRAGRDSILMGFATPGAGPRPVTWMAEQSATGEKKGPFAEVYVAGSNAAEAPLRDANTITIIGGLGGLTLPATAQVRTIRVYNATGAPQRVYAPAATGGKLVVAGVLRDYLEIPIIGLAEFHAVLPNVYAVTRSHAWA